MRVVKFHTSMLILQAVAFILLMNTQLKFINNTLYVVLGAVVDAILRTYMHRCIGAYLPSITFYAYNARYSLK
jgi:hypothetical protein